MSGRRSHPRFAVITPWDGAMRVLREIVVQRTNADELLAVSHLPAIVGEEMTLDILSAGAAVGLRVRVAESRPVVVAGAVRHRLRLTMLNAVPVASVAPQPMAAQTNVVVAGNAPAAETCQVEALDAILSANDVVAVLRRDVTVRLLDISSSGCLLQAETRLPEGTTGTLRLSYEGLEYVDDVRIMRCQAPHSGETCFRLGAEFLWTTHPGERSLRRVVSGLQPDALKDTRVRMEEQS